MSLDHIWPAALVATALALSHGPVLGSPCAAPPGVWGGFAALARAKPPLQGDQALTIVALGSSSTAGTGASSPDHSYPAQLQSLLERRFPAASVRVVNRGIGGETVAANLVRLDRDVLALQPDLVIWQVGTNDALLAVPPLTVRRELLEGIERVRATGADIVLLDPQPLPQADRERAVERVRAVLVEVAQTAGVPLLSRHELMRYWLDSGQLDAASVLGPDGLHMTDTSYLCLAERIADLFPLRPGDDAAGAS